MNRVPSTLVDDVSMAVIEADRLGAIKFMLPEIDDEDRQHIDAITAQISEHRKDLAFSWTSIGACPVLVVEVTTFKIDGSSMRQGDPLSLDSGGHVGSEAGTSPGQPHSAQSVEVMS